LAGREQDVRARDAWSRQALQLALWARLDAGAELCIPDAVPSAARSCAALEAAAVQQPREGRLDAGVLQESAARRRPELEVLQARAAQLLPEAEQRDAAEPQPTALLEPQMEPRAEQQLPDVPQVELQLRDAVQAQG